MSYNLSTYKFQPGDHVAVVARRVGMSTRLEDGEVVAQWDFSKGNTGIIVQVWKTNWAENTPPWIDVEPDEELGFGVHTFATECVTKIGG